MDNLRLKRVTAAVRRHPDLQAALVEAECAAVPAVVQQARQQVARAERNDAVPKMLQFPGVVEQLTAYERTQAHNWVKQWRLIAQKRQETPNERTMVVLG